MPFPENARIVDNQYKSYAFIKHLLHSVFSATSFYCLGFSLVNFKHVQLRWDDTYVFNREEISPAGVMSEMWPSDRVCFHLDSCHIKILGPFGLDQRLIVSAQVHVIGCVK